MQARSRDTAFVRVTGLRSETNDLVRPDEHVLGPPLGIRRVSGNFVPYRRQLPGNAGPFTCLKTRSEHGLLYPNTAGHRHIPSCMTESLHVAGRDLRFPWFKRSTPVGPHYDVVPGPRNISPSTPHLSPRKARVYGPIPGMFVTRFIRRRVSKNIGRTVLLR